MTARKCLGWLFPVALFVVVLAASIAFAGGRCSHGFPATLSAVVDAAGPPAQYTGPGSCSSTSCHGNVAPRAETRVLQNEYSTWIVKDKHSKAYAALGGPIGTRIATILGLGKAETSPKCLACHALEVPAAERGRTFDLSDGVSCESCHGPAAAWLGPHTTRDWTHEKSLAAGMYDTRDLVKRTEKCLSCHLGNQEKFVDHEMIAAGHPDLSFELDSFSAVMPRHWKEPEVGSDDPWYGVRDWGAGQAVQLRQSLERLAGRARGKVWPEYSELQCFACHHSLTPPEQSWRQARGYPERRPGDPPWNASRYAVFRELVRQVDAESAKRLDVELARVTQLMSQLNPDRESVAAAATNSAQLADGLTHKLVALPYDQALTLRLLQQISGDTENISEQGERAAEQAAMALESLFVAYSRNVKSQNASELRAAISDLFHEFQNPSAYDPGRFASQMRKVNGLLH